MKLELLSTPLYVWYEYGLPTNLDVSHCGETVSVKPVIKALNATHSLLSLIPFIWTGIKSLSSVAGPALNILLTFQYNFITYFCTYISKLIFQIEI